MSNPSYLDFKKNSVENKRIESDSRMAALFFLFFLLSTVLIIAASLGDLWLDEIWSFFFADFSNNPFEIITLHKHDNNHVLNTLYLRLVGEQNHFVIYRLLSVFSGIGSILILGYLGKKRGSIERICITVMAGTSYPLVLYFSEARGYAPAIFFSLLSLVILKDNWNSYSKSKVLFFWITIILGILSHATFVVVLFSLFSYSIAHEFKNPVNKQNGLLRMCSYYVVPFGFFIFFYFFYLKNMAIGRGPVYDWLDVIFNSLILMLGFPDSSFFSAIALLCSAAVVMAGTYMLYKDGDEQWAFFPVILFIAPFMLIVTTQPKYLYFRYFILSFPFFYLLLSYILGKFYSSGIKGARSLVIIIIGFFFFGQVQRLIPLLEYGRGNYMEAIKKIATDSSEDLVFIGSDDDFGNKLLLMFYTRFLPDKSRFKYIDRENWEIKKPMWILNHSQSLTYKPPETLNFLKVGTYKFINQYKFSGNSGWGWFLYRRQQSENNISNI